MELTIAQKLEALMKLQEIDSALDEIRKIRGDLPEEVQDLEDEIAGYETRIQKFRAEEKALEDQVADRNNAIKESKKLIEKYEQQQMNVRNNREYDAITKEIELQDLEIQIAQKKIKEGQLAVEAKQQTIATTQGAMDERKKDLENKKKELDVIISETELEEEKLRKDWEKAVLNIETRLLRSYEKVRENSTNGLAVVTVKRDACGGCFNMVPPQRQADIREKKKVIVCEHCGRILADVEMVEEVEKPKRTSAFKRKIESA